MGLGDFLDPGDIFGFQQDSRVGKANAAAKEAYDKAMETSNANRALYSQYLNKMNGTYGDVAGKYGDYLSNIENQEVYDPGQFSYDKDVNDFYFLNGTNNLRSTLTMCTLENAMLNIVSHTIGLLVLIARTSTYHDAYICHLAHRLLMNDSQTIGKCMVEYFHES